MSHIKREDIQLLFNSLAEGVYNSKDVLWGSRLTERERRLLRVRHLCGRNTKLGHAISASVVISLRNSKTCGSIINDKVTPADTVPATEALTSCVCVCEGSRTPHTTTTVRAVWLRMHMITYTASYYFKTN